MSANCSNSSSARRLLLPLLLLLLLLLQKLRPLADAFADAALVVGDDRAQRPVGEELLAVQLRAGQRRRVVLLEPLQDAPALVRVPVCCHHRVLELFLGDGAQQRLHVGVGVVRGAVLVPSAAAAAAATTTTTTVVVVVKAAAAPAATTHVVEAVVHPERTPVPDHRRVRR